MNQADNLRDCMTNNLAFWGVLIASLAVLMGCQGTSSATPLFNPMPVTPSTQTSTLDVDDPSRTEIEAVESPELEELDPAEGNTEGGTEVSIGGSDPSITVVEGIDETTGMSPGSGSLVPAESNRTGTPTPVFQATPDKSTTSEIPGPPVKTPLTMSPTSECHPSYEGACLRLEASDYDCIGGSDDGPFYTGRVRVVGPDVFGLDADGDGIGCD